MIYHIIPQNDLTEHCDDESLACPCLPIVEDYGDNQCVIHNAFDGREALEEDSEVIRH